MAHSLHAQCGSFEVRQRVGFDAMLRAECVHDGAVEVFAAEQVVASGGVYLHHAIEEFKQRYIERAATQIDDQNAVLVQRIVQPVGNGRSSGLVHQSLDLETCKLTGNACGPALPIQRLNAAMVRVGCVNRRSFAAWPTTTVPSASTLTTDGVRRSPSALAMSSGLPFCQSAMALLVVPRSIPIIVTTLCLIGVSAGPAISAIAVRQGCDR